MSDATLHLWSVILVMAAATFATRLTPFVLLQHRADHPLLLYLGRYMPPAVMTLLVLYSLLGMDLSSLRAGLPVLIAGGLTLGIHSWLRHPLLSIFSGTGCYMLLIQSGLLAPA